MGNEEGKLGRRGRGEERRGFEESFRDSKSVAEERKKREAEESSKGAGEPWKLHRGPDSLCMLLLAEQRGLGRDENI